jgi:hypothetical protein
VSSGSNPSVGKILIEGIFNKEEISFNIHVDLMVGDHPTSEDFLART